MPEILVAQRHLKGGGSAGDWTWGAKGRRPGGQETVDAERTGSEQMEAGRRERGKR